MKRRPRLIELNDHFRNEVISERLGVPVRRTLPGLIRFTMGAAEASRSTSRLLKAILRYNDFEKDNEFDEHDYGIFKFGGISYNWKIDLYGDPMCIDGLAPLPKDLRKCHRVLTVYLADED